MTSPASRRGMILALCATLFYGQVPVLAKFAFLHGVDGIAVVLARTGFIALALGAFAWRARSQLAGLWQIKAWLLLQALATLLVSTGLILSVQFIPASLAVIIFFAAPLIVLFAAPLIEGETPGAARIAAGLLGFAGLALALGPSLHSLDPRGLGLAAAAAFGYALQFFSGRKLAATTQPLLLAWAVHGLVLPVVTAFFFAAPKAAATAIDVTGLVAMLAVCAVYVLGYTLHMASLAQTQASRVVMFFNFEPVVTMTTAAALLGERLSNNQYAGFSGVIIALFLGSRASKTATALSA